MLFATEVMVAKKMVKVTVPRIKALTAAATTTAVSSAIVSLLPAGYVVRVSYEFLSYLSLVLPWPLFQT